MLDLPGCGARALTVPKRCLNNMHLRFPTTGRTMGDQSAPRGTDEIAKLGWFPGGASRQPRGGTMGHVMVVGRRRESGDGIP